MALTKLKQSWTQTPNHSVDILSQSSECLLSVACCPPSVISANKSASVPRWCQGCPQETYFKQHHYQFDILTTTVHEDKALSTCAVVPHLNFAYTASTERVNDKDMTCGSSVQWGTGSVSIINTLGNSHSKRTLKSMCSDVKDCSGSKLTFIPVLLNDHMGFLLTRTTWSFQSQKLRTRVVP